MRLLTVNLVTDRDIDAEYRLEAMPARRLIEAHGAEHVGAVGQCQCRLTVGTGGLHQRLDPHRAVDNRKLGMQAQMNEARQGFSHELDSSGRRAIVRRRAQQSQ